MVYFDSASFFPPARDAVAAMELAMRESWGNPESLHETGERARRLLDHARHHVASYMGTSSVEIVLTTQGRSALDKGFALARQDAEDASPGSGFLVSSRLEHPHVQALVERAAAEGANVRWLALPEGVPTEADRALLADAKLVVLSAVNHEMGTAFPLETHAVRLIDATQAAAWLPLEGYLDDRTFVAFSGTKLGAPAAVGVLRVPRRIRDAANARKRPLEETPPPWLAAIGLGAACEAREMHRSAHLEVARERARELLDGLRTLDPGLRVNGAESARLGPILDVSFTRVEALSLVTLLGINGLAISHTAACQARAREQSPVVRAAYPEDPERALGATRWSLSEHVRPADIQRALAIVAPFLDKLRQAPLVIPPLPPMPPVGSSPSPWDGP